MKQWSPGGEGGTEIEFMEKMPGLTDELKVTTDLGKYVIVARRKGDTWYVASMAGPKAQSVDFPLSFLTKGASYKASIYFDTPGERKASHKSEVFTSATVVPIKMEPNGGHLMIIEANK
jgi:alpha-glucosidase